MAILSFDGRVNIAVRIVTEKFPKAKLYEADGVATGGPTTRPAMIDHLKVVFQNENNSTVIIEEIGYGEFGAPVLIPEPWLEDLVIDWPVKIDLPEANDLKNAAGFTATYANVTLRAPLYKVKFNPCFIFGMTTGIFVFVDTVTKKVFTE